MFRRGCVPRRRRRPRPTYCFYLTTIDCGAARPRFRGAQAAIAREPSPMPAAKPITGVMGSERPTSEDVTTAVALLEAGDASAAETLFGAIEHGSAAGS